MNTLVTDPRRQRVKVAYLRRKTKLYALGLVVRARLAGGSLAIRDGPRAATVMFVPHPPSHVYGLWKLARMTRLRVVPPGTGTADIVIRFEDVTCPAIDRTVTARWHDLNAGCTNISKDYVATRFAEVFGYGLAIDPLTYTGIAVAKSLENCRKDGRIVQCPLAAVEPGQAYQKRVDTSRGGDVVDLRTGIVGARLVSVVEIRRPLATPFVEGSTSATLIATDAAFTPGEQADILEFCRRIGLDVGELDILRDNEDGRIYIVDANKTSSGPSLNLGLSGCYRVLEKAARAFKEQYGQPAAG